MLIQMDRPSHCRKKIFLTAYGKEKYTRAKRQKFWANQSWCRSPLNMGEEDPNLFLNNWNLSQTFYLKGRTTVKRFERFKEILRQRCINATIAESASIGVQILDMRSTKDEMKALRVRGHYFRKRLDRFRL